MESTRTANDGCFVSATTGFILTFLAILLAIAAGVSVYLIIRPGHVTCHCSCSSDHLRKVVSAGKDVGLSQTTGAQQNTTLKYEVQCATKNCSSGNVSQPVITTPGPEIRVSYRLPISLLPVLYNLEVMPNIYEKHPTNFTLEGHVRIMMNCSKETTNVTLHLNQLTLINDSIDITGNSDCLNLGLKVKNYERDIARQFVILHLNKALRPGCQYNLTLNFTAPLTDSLSGIFYSTYQHSGSNRYLAATLFSPIYARNVFPCFDEPQLKARFAVTIVRRPDFTSLSNMDLLRTTDRPGGFVADEYNTSPPMSTYLVGIVVCDYQQMTKYTKDGTKVRLWAPEEYLSHGNMALDVAVKLMEFYADHFDIPYSLPKLDLVPVPDYIVLGMENWGLITFRQTSLLYDPLSNSVREKAIIVRIIAHEIAHLWFGDLVTMCWWSELWLKEGFASYLEYIGTRHLFKEWAMLEYFVLIDLHPVLLPDSLKNTAPIVQPVEAPVEIQMAFSAIPYSKGSCLLRMMEFIFGEATYTSALRIYLKSKAYGCSTRFDFWSALQQSLSPTQELNITAIMETWVLQKHYPVVTIKRNGSALVVTQNKFRLDAQLKPEQSIFGYRWEIPLTYTTSEERDFHNRRIIYIHRNQNETRIPDVLQHPLKDSETWVIGNIQQYGYYRVNYDVTNWNALIRQLKQDHTVIPTVNRAQLINDAWNLAKARVIDQRVALGTVEYLAKEREYGPWAAASYQLKTLTGILYSTGVYSKFKQFMRRTLKPHFQNVTWVSGNMSYGDELFRVEIVSLACEFELRECVKTAKTYFHEWMDKNTTVLHSVAPDLRFVVYKTAIKYGDDTEWEFVYRKYKTAQAGAERNRLRLALAYSRDVWILKRFLEMTLDPTEIRKQDSSGTMSEISSSVLGRELVWDFVFKRWEHFMKVYGLRTLSLSALLIDITNSFTTMEDYNKLIDFMTQHPEQTAKSGTILQSAERTLANIHWLKMNLPIISDWLEEQLSN